ncbi:peptidylprolyl isomerase [Listeria sp. PSOL-1]|uniref:peptidylprolyl isomerase n=1 Tax=Listeria sp. PSOL-1 TaxID=1844999 RepID=UPI0013D48D57|nr:peptidylprolyl isomerase [Listeria sp. PSOL-1]
MCASVLLVLASCGNGDIIAKTDAGNITKEDLYKTMKESSGNQFLQQAIIQKVLNKKYKVSDKEVQALTDQYKQQYGGQYPEEQLKNSAKTNLLVQKATENYIGVNDKKLKEYYKTWKPKITVSHILVKDEKTAKEVESKLKDGDKFADLAKKYSTDTSNKDDGGKLKEFGPGEMEPEFEKAAYALKKEGDISEPVKTKYGYHVIKLDKLGQKTTFEKDKEQVKKDYLASKMNQETQTKAIAKEVKAANVKIEDKDLKSALDGITK